MTSNFIVWNKGIDVSFRRRYYAITDEYIQDSPPSTTDLVSYYVGSSRLTEEMIDSLLLEFPTGLSIS